MKRVFGLLQTAALILLIAVLTGCTEMSSLGDGRMTAWKEVRKSEEATKQEFLRTKQAEFQNKTTNAQRPTLSLKTYDDQGRVTGQADMDLQPMFAELGLKKEGDTYGVSITATPQPKGQIAESLDAAGGTAVGVLSAPGTVVYATAKGITAGLKETGGGGTKINAETVDINESFNKAESHNLGSGSAAASTSTGGTASPAAEVAGSGSVVPTADYAACTSGGATLGAAASCLAGKGYDINITGGLAYLDGEPYDALNLWEAAK